ncbi:MAG: hypothetical protein ACTHMC_22265 [Pseudobacter sp.]|uniref:hypothetical protein n=1 Tax=Pseudobacter sp. TaxID=2045420 RepID=UPI003F7DD632
MISMGGTAIKNFSKEFDWNGQVIMVEFITMNCVEKQLYQVYLPALPPGPTDKKIRIHMQRDSKGDFKIMGENVCPPEYLGMEAALDEAIKNY